MSYSFKEIPKIYDPKAVEDKWYRYWLHHGFFRSVPDKREPYTIVIPPPNVTGVLHMGHMLNNTIQDVLIRMKRMQGYNACWVPGTDHASIATEAKVVALLGEKGIKKTDLSRDEFLKHAWEWKEKYGGIILKQLEKLGASCDWERTRFTMENDLSEAVIDVFIDLYNKGYIYRGVRMVNWDPEGLTAVSDEEVIHKEVSSRLYYVNYPLLDKNEIPDAQTISDKLKSKNVITIATVRPETILGDTAVCVHPEDLRYKNLRGKFAVIPFVNRKVPVIFDEYITMDFGTGALKVTPAHDINDYNLGLKHHLEVIDTIAANGTMSEAAQFYIGEDRFAVRKKIVQDLEEAGYIQKIEHYKNKVGYSERTNAVIEPKLSLQWFLKMDKISRPALDAVLNGNVKLIPEKFISSYKHWMENVHDWCISRQLWWGQRIPAWYDDKGNFAVAKTEAGAIEIFKMQNPGFKNQELYRDEDVLDTWFSSWLWPISVFDGFKNPGNPDIKYYYPTNDLVTAPEILFFWVARMIMAGYEYRNEKPFTNVYLTGIVRDKQGRKMSKQLGNSPDPIELINKYSADGVRVGMLLSSPAGNDLLFDESLCEQGRNFANKIWNAFRLISTWIPREFEKPAPAPETGSKDISVRWFENRFQQALSEINNHYSKYRMSDALMSTYKLVWDDFCSWYLEMVKPDFGMPIEKIIFDATIHFFENILKVLHPWMPFITEELWHLVKSREANECIIAASWPGQKSFDDELLTRFEVFTATVVNIRNIRAQKNISQKEPLHLLVKKQSTGNETNPFEKLIRKLGNISEITYVSHKVNNAASYIIDGVEHYIPLSDKIDVAAEKEKLLKEIEYNRGFLKAVENKLGNQNFVAKAKPEIIATEQKKKADAEGKLKALEEQLAELGS